MKPIPREARTNNLHGSERCRYCANTGWVVVRERPLTRTLRPTRPRTPDPAARIEEYGPCPYCQIGLQVEFPDESSNVKPPWGSAGFWQGRDNVDLRPIEGDGRPLYGEALQTAMAALRDACRVLPDVDEELGEGDDDLNVGLGLTPEPAPAAASPAGASPPPAPTTAGLFD